MTSEQQPGDEDEHLRAPLLLHSLAALREVVFPCLDILGARTLVEVGGEDGAFTRELLAWAEKRGGSVYCVEPEPSEALTRLLGRSDAGELVPERSPQALDKLDNADVYLLDGDHNYYTVRSELETIAGKSGVLPLVFVHDIGWPCGRRDQYYSPESLPAEAVHPYTYERGVTTGSSATVQGGFRGGGEFAVALEEGGPANGVLTAVEDFLADRQDVALAKVPSVFGLGVLYPASSSEGRDLGEFLRFYRDHPLLERLESNRLSLYLEVLDLNDRLEECGLRVWDVANENSALWARNSELHARVSLLEGEINKLLRSRAFSLAERLSRLRARVSDQPALSRRSLMAILEDERTD